jgi:hypothetical protein
MVVLIATVVAWMLNPQAGKGVLLGGLCAALVWRFSVRSLELANSDPHRVKFCERRWRLVRYVVYVAVLVKGYTLDTAHFYGFFGAAIGIWLIFTLMRVTAFIQAALESKKE